MRSPPTRVVWIEISAKKLINEVDASSPPTRVVWIEIFKIIATIRNKVSPPTRVVWIEIIQWL